MKNKLAIDDKNTTLTHLALSWDIELKSWYLLSLGRDKEEIKNRVKYWKGKGVENIKIFELKKVIDEG